MPFQIVASTVVDLLIKFCRVLSIDSIIRIDESPDFKCIFNDNLEKMCKIYVAMKVTEMEFALNIIMLKPNRCNGFQTHQFLLFKSRIFASLFV